MADKQRKTWLTCVCCGKRTAGRQWKNRYRGFGICPDCAREEARKLDPDEMVESYGVMGTHYYLDDTNGASE